MGRRAYATWIGLGLAAAACAPPLWLGHRPMFPSGAESWEIPLYEPLTGFGPKVIATVCGAARAGHARVCEETLLYVDTGSSYSALPAAAFERLGVQTSGSRFATITDAAGETRAWSGGLVPEMRLGSLVLTDVVAVVHEKIAILGADVLTARGWRIDYDRGTLVLGAQPSPGAGASRLPIRGFPRRTIVDLFVQGRSVPMLLDTGAGFTIVDVSWLRAAGLPLRPLAHGWPLSTRDPSLRLGEATVADLRLGDLDLGHRQVVAHPRGDDELTLGMLGLDLLSDFAFGVSNGALDLVPRAPSPLAAAGDRIGRWRDLPRCPDLPGCISAELEPGPAVRVRVHLAAPSPRAQRYLFGCVDHEGRLGKSPFWVEVGLRAAAAGQERVVEVEMPERLRPFFLAGCPSLALLDVNPVLPAVRPMTGEAEARFTLGSRRLRLD